ncbi:hypothetical protein BS78_04G080400 [Paspalum vaginatum]|nr:hypothetical protein BS78_04G080400 [Paspalum vaginatum]
MAAKDHVSAATTARQAPAPHFVLVPLAAQGHIIPLVDLALLLADRGARASVVAAPLNVARLGGVAERAARAGLPLDFVELPFPPGVPDEWQSADLLPENSQLLPFSFAQRELAGPFDAYVRALAPRPSCIVSDWCSPWTAGVARSLGIPRVFFHGPSCLFSLCDLLAANHGLHDRIAAGGDDEKHALALPGMPVPVVVTKATAPGFYTHPSCKQLRDEAMEAMRTADGVVVNTFLDAEAEFLARYQAELGKPVWAVGPLSLCNRDAAAMASRGNTAAAAAHQQRITAWLDAQAAGSVVYVSFGSVARKLPKQLFEVGHGLEDSGAPFLWVVKEAEAAMPEVERWLEALEARTAGRGLVVRGWAPQLAVLTHRAVGGFVTHCGWNSLLEAITYGVPVVTWPHFMDQFLNERLAVDVLWIGVPVGVTAPVFVMDDEAVLVGRGDVARAVAALMGGGQEADERRRKVREYGQKAHRAMEKGGSSYEHLTRLVQSFTQQGEVKQH